MEDNTNNNGKKNINTIKKYPKSRRGFQCVGPCYKKNTTIVHPMYFAIRTDLDHSFCPVEEWKYVDPKTKKSEKLITDVCDDNNPNVVMDPQDLLFPYIEFNTHMFLTTFYNIASFADGIDWITENKEKYPSNTLVRIFDLVFQTYGENTDIISINDPRIIDFIYYIVKNKFLDDIILKIAKYIYIDNNSKKVYLKYNTAKDTSESIVVKTNYVLENIINIDNLSKFLIKYFRSRQNVFAGSTMENIVAGYISNIVNKINISI